MTVFLSMEKDGILVQAMAESDDSRIGDMMHVVAPGGSFGPYSYDDLLRMGSGQAELKFPGEGKSESVDNTQR